MVPVVVLPTMGSGEDVLKRGVPGVLIGPILREQDNAGMRKERMWLQCLLVPSVRVIRSGKGA